MRVSNVWTVLESKRRQLVLFGGYTVSANVKNCIRGAIEYMTEDSEILGRAALLAGADHQGYEPAAPSYRDLLFVCIFS